MPYWEVEYIETRTATVLVEADTWHDAEAKVENNAKDLDCDSEETCNAIELPKDEYETKLSFIIKPSE